MPIKISVTYEVVTEESAEHGEAAEHGYEFEDADYGFRELVDYIRREGFIHPSDYPGIPRWLTTEGRIVWAGDCSETKSLSIHPGKDARSQKYWAKACKAAGVIKG